MVAGVGYDFVTRPQGFRQSSAASSHLPDGEPVRYTLLSLSLLSTSLVLSNRKQLPLSHPEGVMNSSPMPSSETERAATDYDYMSKSKSGTAYQKYVLPAAVRATTAYQKYVQPAAARVATAAYEKYVRPAAARVATAAYQKYVAGPSTAPVVEPSGAQRAAAAAAESAAAYRKYVAGPAATRAVRLSDAERAAAAAAESAAAYRKYVAGPVAAPSDAEGPAAPKPGGRPRPQVGGHQGASRSMRC